MARKRQSLAEISRQDQEMMMEKTNGGVSAKVLEKKSDLGNRKKEIGNNISDHGKRKSEIVKTKSESPASDAVMAKLSVMIPLEVLETLQDISKKRRRDKKPFTLSVFVREALNGWMEKNC